tara:strand:- start:589 stop:4302 length:3714 start_codon:yes stop_codon:yes gene_type:complete
MNSYNYDLVSKQELKLKDLTKALALVSGKTISQKEKNVIKFTLYKYKQKNASFIQQIKSDIDELNKVILKNKTKEIPAKNIILTNNIEMEKDPEFKKMTFVAKKWKVPFYKKRHVANCNMKDCSCLKPVRLLEKHLKKNEILIHSKYKGAYLFGKINRNNFTNLVSKNRSIYETLYSEYPRRLYIDVDGINSDCLKNAKEVLWKVFPKNVRMSISGSVGEKRGKPFYSYHIILPDIVFKNLDEMKTSGFHEFIKSQANKETNGIDKCVYGNTQQFKAVNQSKHKSNRIQNIIENNNVEEHIIQTFTQTPNAMQYKNKFAQHIKFEIKKTNLKAYKSGKKCGISGFTLEDIVPLTDTPIPNIDFQFDPALKLLHHIPNRKGKGKLGRTIMWCIMNWFYHEEGETKTAFKLFQKWEKPHERNTPQSYQSWKDCSKCKQWWGRQKIQHLLEKVYGTALPNPRLDRFNKQFISGIIEGITNTKCDTKYLKQEHIGNEKYCCMKLGMGKGKTYTTIEWLIKEVRKNPDLKICWITNRISMALNLMDRLNGNNDKSLNTKVVKSKQQTLFGEKEIEKTVKVEGRDMQFVNYKDVGKTGFGGQAQKNNKYHMIRNEIKRIVIELESIHYSAGTTETDWLSEAGMKYDIVVIDEIESVFNSFRSDTTHGAGRFYDTNYHRYEEVMKDAKKVFLMDAYLHHRTIEYVKILDPNASINLIQADDDKIDKVINIHQSFYSWYNKIMTDINEGKKLYIFYPFKTGKGSIQKLSIDGLKQRLLNNCNPPDLEKIQQNYDNQIKEIEDRCRAKANKANCKSEETREVYFNKLFSNASAKVEKYNPPPFTGKGIKDEEILVYHGDMSDKEKQKLQNVNDVWGKAKVVITNSCISVGVNYEYDDFDKVYLSYGDILNPRDVIQSSFRVRKTKEDIIEFYRFPNLFKIIAKKKGIMFEPAPINKPKLEVNTDAFMYMRKFLMEEYNAKGHETLKRFFKETGYIIKNKFVGGDDDPIHYKAFDGEGTLGVWEWANIKCISKQDKEKLEGRIFDNSATIDSKLEVRKWYNDVSFKKSYTFNKDTNKWVCDEGVDAVKEMFYKRPMYLKGFKAIWEKSGIMHNVINLVDGEYEYNNDKLSEKSKYEIEEYLHLTDLVETGKAHTKRFMQQSDHVIKKKIIIHYFGSYIMNKKEDWEDRSQGEFDSKFTEWCDLTKKYAKKVAPITPKEIKDRSVKLLKKKFRKNKFLQGICFLDLDE